MAELYLINSKLYRVLKLLGHGKSGYSYLVKDDRENLFVVKKIHHELIDYYTFGDKFQAELDAYELLSNIGILMPRLIDHDRKQEVLLKEYVEGTTVYDNLRLDKDISETLDRMYDISIVCRSNDINIDYFPTNFINKDEGLYYIDYELNDYMEAWSFENWGIKYWSKSDAFIEYSKKQDNK